MKNLCAGILCLTFISVCLSQTSNQITWQQTNGPYGGDVGALALFDTNLFAGTNGSGVFRSTNNGASWTAMNSGLTNTWVNALLVSGTNLFAGTSGGVFLSTDNGASWNFFNTGLTNTSVQSLAMSGTNLYAGTSGGVFLSTNNGLIWNAINTGLTNTSVWGLAVSGTNLFAGTSEGIFRTTNNGTSWSSVNTGLPTTQVYCFAVSGTNLFAGTWSGVFLSTDNGATWTAMNSGLTNTIVKSFVISGTNLYAGTMGGVYLSANNGSSWSAINSGFTNTIVRALAVSGANVFAGTGGRGVFLSTNNGGVWNTVNTGMTGCNVKALTANPANGGPGSINLFAGTSGGDIFLSTDNGSNWNTVNNGLAYYQINALTVSGSNILAGTTSGIFLSTNNGSSWIPINAGISTSDVRSFAVQGANLFAGTWSDGVFRSTNNGLTWSAVNTGFPTTAIVYNLAPCGANLFAYTFNNGVFLTTNNGSSWNAVNSGLTNTNIQSLAAIGSNLFAGTGSGVFLSTNNGTNWNAVNTGLPSTYVPVLTAISTYLFAGTGSGVFLSTNNGSSWSAINTGLTNTSVQVFANSSTNLFAGTSSGVFMSLINTPPAAPQHLSAAAGNAQVTLQWNKNTETDFSRYRIYRGTSPNPTTQVDSTTGGITDTIKVYTGLTNDTTYYFRITAEDNLGLESGYSDNVHATPYQPTLVMNPSFENGSNGIPDNWKAINYGDATLNWTNTISHIGIYSISVSNISNSQNIQSKWVSDYMDVTPNTAYEFSYWVYVTKAPQTGQYFKVSEDFYDSLGNYITSNSSNAIYTLNQWQNNDQKTIAYQTAAKIRFTISFNSNGQSYDGVGYFDDFKLSQINPIVSLKVLKPKGGDTLIAKSTYTIQWVSQNITSVDIKVSYNGGGDVNKYWLTIAKGIPTSQGSYSWTMPDTISNNTAIWLNDSYNSDYSASTDNTKGVIIVKATYTMLLNSKNLNVGAARIGQSKDTAFTMTNKGNSNLIISNITSTDTCFTARLSSLTIAPGATVKDTLKFSPGRFGADSAKIVITSNAPSSPDTIVVTAISPTPVFASLKTSVSYGSVARNTTKKDTIKIVNNSINTLIIDSIFTKTNTFQADHISGTVGTDTMKIVVSFTPTALASYGDTVYLRNNSATPLVKIPLSGNCPAPLLTASAAALTLPNQAKGNYTKVTSYLKNRSVNLMTITTVTTKTTIFNAYIDSTMVAGLDSTALTVIFWPKSIGTFIDTVTIVSDGGTAKIPLVGSCPYPVLVPNKTSVVFGDVAKNTTKKDTIKISNTSINILTIDTIYTRTTVFAVNQINGTVGTDTLKIVVSFTPTLCVSLTDTVYLRNDSAIPLMKIPCSGNAPAPILAFRTTSVSFGTVRKDTPVIKNIIITNSSISALSIDSLYTMTKYFTMSAVKIPAIVNTGDTFMVAVSFKPDTMRLYTDTLYVKNNSNTSVAKVSLVGIGTLTSVQSMLGGIPGQYELSQNFPNPFNPNTTLKYGLPAQSSVRLVIYNVLGQAVKVLVSTEQNAGYKSIVWNADVSSGIYFYRLEATPIDDPSKQFVETKKMLILK